MGSKFGGGDDELIADINITPFVDIILVVLILFMVTATTIVQSSIKVSLPDGVTGEATETTSLGLTLLGDGGLLLDGAPITEAALRARLIEANSSSEDVTCLISAEKDVAHGRVVWLIDTVKFHGITKFAININKVDMIGPDPRSSVPVPVVPVPIVSPPGVPSPLAPGEGG